MALVNVMVGAPQSQGAVIACKVDTGPVRVAVADNPGMSSLEFFGPETVDAQGVAKMTVSGLDPGAPYWFQVEDNGVLDTGVTGRFRTTPTPGSAASFKFGAAGDAGLSPDFPGDAGGELDADRLSNTPAWDTMRQRALAEDWLFHLNLGDWGYPDWGDRNTDTVSNRRQFWDDQLAQSNQAPFMREVSQVLAWEDHDYAHGNADGTYANKANAAQVYRERMPHHPLPASGPTYHSFEVGRVLFLVADVRYEKDPLDDPDNSAKSMLGPAQKSWMQGVLAASSAQFLVWVMASQWTHSGPDTWASYLTERTEVAQIFSDTGWTNRMATIGADAHALYLMSEDMTRTVAPFISSHFPEYHFASVDATPTNGPQSNVGPGGSITSPSISNNSPGRMRFGEMEIQDDGDSITIVGTGYAAGSAWNSYSYTFVINPGPEPKPEPEPTPQPVAQATIRRRITWLGVHAVTGRVIAELPDVRGEVSRLLSAYKSSRLTMPIPLAGPGSIDIAIVEQATQPLGTCLVAVVNDLPTWMGWVLTRRGGTGAELQLATVTPEGYLVRRRIRDHAFTDTDRTEVAQALLADAGDLVDVGAGLGFEVAATLTGDTISREYLASDRQTVYDGLRELAADGLEFTVDLDWTDNTRTVVRRIMRLGPRVGKSDGDALFETTASSMFESQAGSEATYDLLEDHTSGKSANHLTVVAPGEGEDQPASAPAIDQVALDGGLPVVEDVVQVSSATTDQDELDAIAAAELTRVKAGAQVWEINARLDAYPRPGIDAQIGDSVGFLLTGHRHPRGVTGQRRMIGYTLDQQAGMWRPLLLQPGEEV